MVEQPTLRSGKGSARNRADASTYGAAVARVLARMSRLRLLAGNNGGAATIEYALLVGMIAVALVIALTNVGSGVRSSLNAAETGVVGKQYDTGG
jgi:Flp pilus assembly pilin Flp